MRPLATWRRRLSFITAFGCALCGALWLSSLLTAQEDEALNDYFPHRPLYADDELWNEPPVYVPVMPVDLPPVTQAEYQQPVADRTFSVLAPVHYQAPLPRPESPPEPIDAEALEPIPADHEWPTPSCLDCGGGFGGCGGCGGGCGSCGGCNACEPCVAKTRTGRFACELYRALCCPDPCYIPQWTGIANAAFWVESARPVTQTRYRWDMAFDMIYPDRAEYIWPQVGAIGPAVAPNSLMFHELSMYSEVANGNFSFFVDTPYRSYNTDADVHAAGFTDINLGTKSLLFDCDLLQITFQFRTWIPSGNGLKGLGTEHVSLEPSLLMALNLAPDTYAQAQIAEWIPVGADGGAGAILHYHASLNQVLWRWQPSIPIIGTLEANGWSFQDGQYTSPTLGQQSASGETYVSAGPGIRVVVCDKIDFGIGSAFAVTENHWGEQTLRSEFRWRF